MMCKYSYEMVSTWQCTREADRHSKAMMRHLLCMLTEIATIFFFLRMKEERELKKENKNGGKKQGAISGKHVNELKLLRSTNGNGKLLLQL